MFNSRLFKAWNTYRASVGFVIVAQSSHPAVSEEDDKMEAPKASSSTLETAENKKGKIENRNTWNYVEEKQYLQVGKELPRN